MWALIVCFVAFLAWALLAKLDIVLVGEGKLVPDGFVQAVQAPEDGVIRKTLVKDGDTVKAGQALVELDLVYAQEDTAAAAAEVKSLQNKLSRIDAELAGVDLTTDDAQTLAEFRHRRAMQLSLVNEANRALDQAQTEKRTAQERLRKYKELEPISAKQAEMTEQLRASGLVSEASHNEKLMNHIELARERDVQARAVDTAGAQVRAAQASLERVEADYLRQLSVERTETLLRLNQASATLHKQEHRVGLQVLKAPVDGQVTGLKVMSSAQVAKAGEVLLSLVPAGQALRFEGWLRNEDSAFVAPGMPAKVKLAAYPFQKYGWLEGSLEWIGVDSETPDAMRNAQGEPLFYRVRVKLADQQLHLDGKDLALKPGMQSTADLQVGTRTLFEYLTSPMRKVALEAARER
ncbi:HlyD family type I secretion periplasmic adaptor subunit [Burkholderia ubonensis]|uniref:HlyD family type I secretion periplasmic adaptor subunit n=1 Tax=Burkholderia ubonensis TaxID=101571 RepID=UPI00075EA4FE|nr:HlyD family type I secretion periplasmic adaptor subunit [Burkholderia ubonensis]KVP16872.1 hypothetical protein WJ84_00945 [Burkholderia ubonensis]